MSQNPNCFRMNTKNWFLVGFVTLLALAYVVFYTNVFKRQSIGIFHTVRVAQLKNVSAGSNPSLVFGLSGRFKLTEIKLIAPGLPEITGQSLPLWHLVTSSNSVPIKSFFYGEHIRGLKPAVPGSSPEPLATNVPYRLIVNAGKIRGEHDFILK